MRKYPYSWSQLNLFVTCPRRYYWKYVRQLTRPTIDYGMTFGKFMHGIVQDLYITKDPKKTREAFEEKQLAFFDEHLLLAADDKNISMLFTALDGFILPYFTYYKNDIYHTDVLGTEKEFEFRLLGEPIKTRVDMYVKRGDRKYVYEIKSSSQINRAVVDRYYHDPQTHLYMHGAKTDRVYLDCVARPNIRQGKTEPDERFVDRMLTYYTKEDPEKVFYKDAYRSHKREMDDMIDTFSWIISNIKTAEASKFFPKFRSNCYQWYSACDYLPLCNNGENPVTIEMFEERRYEK